MKKMLIAILVVIFSISTFAASNNPSHIISIDTYGLGLSLQNNKFKTDKDKGLKNQDSSHNTLSLNYNYAFSSGLMIGAYYYYEMNEQEDKFTDGSKVSEEETTSSLALSVGYNFNEDFYNSWWIKGFAGAGTAKIEEKDGGNTERFKGGLNLYGLEAGKRFSFASLDLENFSYSPSIAYGMYTFSKDYKDNGIKSSTSLTLNLLKFDILF